MGKLLGKKEILAANDIKFEDVDVPGWGGTVRVQAMSGTEKDAFEASVRITRRVGGKTENVPNFENVRAKLVSRSIVDEQGNLVFSEDDIDALGKKSSDSLDIVVGVAQRLSRMTDKDLKQLSEQLKNDQPAA